MSALALKYGVTDQQLGTMITDQHIAAVSQFLVRWEDVGPELGLSRVDLQAIKSDPGTTVQTKNRQVLQKWKAAKFRSATYKVLVETLDKLSEAQCANQVCGLIHEMQQQSSNSHVVDDKSASTVEPDANDSDNEAILQRALEDGSVEMQIVKCLVQGPARVGKTHVKALIMKKTLEKDKSPSTNCVEQAVRAICTEKFAGDDESWKEVNAEELMKMLSEEVVIHQRESPPLQTARQELPASLPSSLEVDSNEPEVEVKHFVEELQSLVKNGKGSKMHQKWIYFVDSGGQPQFQNVFQAFIPNTSVLFLVFSLAEELSAFNRHCIQDQDGREASNFVGNTAQTVEDILKSIASTVNSADSKEERKIFLIGTFKDIYEKNQAAYETIEKKEEKLGELFKKEEIQASHTRNTIVFPVNGLHAESGEFEDEVICDIRKQIFGHFKESKRSLIPLRWFALELALERKASSVHRKVLTYKECMAVAKILNIDNKSKLDAALEFLHKCSLLLFYPCLDLVFTDPQALLDHFSAIVFRFVSGSFTGSKAEVDNYKKGILSYRAFEELLDPTPDLKDVLTCDKLLEIFQNLLIAYKMDEDKYFIPALLPMQDIHTARDEAKSVVSPLVPLVFLFSDKCTPRGLFCAVVVKLLKTNWEVKEKAKAYSNAITLLRKKCRPELEITFIDSFKSFEIFCSKEDKLPEIKKKFEEEIKEVISSRNYKYESLQIAFLARCSKCQYATLEEKGKICCECVAYTPEETEQEWKWLKEPPSEDTDGSSGASETNKGPNKCTTTTKLNVDKHLDKLLNKTSDKVSPYWKEVGNKLGFKDDTLGKIPRELALRSERDYYVSMIRKWMNWAPPKHDFATLEALVKAMRDTDIDELMMPAYDLENSKSEFK